MELQEQLKLALTELRKNESKKFKQTVDLIVNLQKFEVKKTPLNIFVRIPHKSKDKKIAAFFESESEFIDTITEIDFKKYSKNFRAYCDEADALRADVEVAAALFDQAKKSPAVDQDKYLLQALSLAKNIHSQGKKFAYPNVVIIAKELLGAIASVSNKEEMSKKYYKEAEKLRASYNYHASNSYRFSQD